MPKQSSQELDERIWRLHIWNGVKLAVSRDHLMTSIILDFLLVLVLLSILLQYTIVIFWCVWRDKLLK
jgi:hypothetical protein